MMPGCLGDIYIFGKYNRRASYRGLNAVLDSDLHLDKYLLPHYDAN